MAGIPVPPQRPQCHAPSLGEIALAQFDEAPEGPQQAEAAFHRLAGQRVQHHIHAIRPGFAQGIGEAGIAAVQHQFRATVSKPSYASRITPDISGFGPRDSSLMRISYLKRFRYAASLRYVL